MCIIISSNSESKIKHNYSSLRSLDFRYWVQFPQSYHNILFYLPLKLYHLRISTSSSQNFAFKQNSSTPSTPSKLKSQVIKNKRIIIRTTNPQVGRRSWSGMNFQGERMSNTEWPKLPLFWHSKFPGQVGHASS